MPVDDAPPDAEGESDSGDPTVSTLRNDEITTEMHDDTTLLRNVSAQDESGKLLFGALRVWVGGAVQYDYYNFDGIYSHSGGGDRREGTAMRRLEGTLRSQPYDWGEIKAQYDFDQGAFRDLYLRWVSPAISTPVTLILDNQKEPVGLDNLTGNKFGFARERASTLHAFGSWRSLGVRLHKAFERKSDERVLDVWEGDTAAITTSVGVFTEDLESSKDTDLAVTGRITAGRERSGVGQHIGVAFSYREGDFYRISMRPEIFHAERVTLARPQSNTLGIAALEAVYNNGPLHLQAEFFGADYAGRVGGFGAGGYLQAGWYLTGESRNYQPKWGILAPHSPQKFYSFEVFARVSHTRGEDDVNGWNDYRSLTLGGNLFYRKVRGSINLLYGKSREPLDGEEEGLALNVRVQYLF